MSDTQWPRFQVFVQEKDGLPHQDAGSVHAPDAEMALLNARDVFARRPECASMWVVPAEGIFSRTAEQLQEWETQANPTEGESATPPHPAMGEEPYYAFCKHRHAGAQTFVGSVQASSPQEALGLAIASFSSDKPPLAWWVFPARLVRRSDPAEVESLYAPAHDKLFRMATDFHTHTAMRQIKKA